MEGVSHTISGMNRAILLIGDTHEPYTHPDYLNFCKAVSRKYGCKIHIHVGDEADGHAISFHNSDQELLSAGNELKLAIKRLKDWHKAFPKMILMESNHGSLIFRRMKAHGIPVRFIKPLDEIYETPGWTWHHDILIQTKYGDVYGCHGKASGYGALAKEQGTSAFQGHYHGKAEVTWHHRVGHQRFNMFVGCGIDWESLAFAYGKNNVPKPILACGVIKDDGMPRVIKMKVNPKGRWTGKL